MQKIKAMHQVILLQSSATALAVALLCLTGNVQTAECLGIVATTAAASCNSTRIADCLPDRDEFPMGSETGRRILQAARGGKKITYPSSSNPSLPYCDSKVYGSCIGKDGKIYKNRPCNYQNTCARPGS